jgi:hypothetical protein
MKMPDDSWSGRYMKKTRADRENSELLKIVGGIVVIATVLRKNSMDDIDPSFECSAFCSLLPGVSLVGTAA